MNDLKSKNGITLIALIITIIILLILAMVTIRILMNQGIIKHAQNATAAYNDAQNNETEYLTYAEGEMDKYTGATGSGVGGDTYTPPAEDVDALRRYFLGTKKDGNINQEGQSIGNVLDMEKEDPNGFAGYAFKDDQKTIGSGDKLELLSNVMQETNGKEIFYYWYVKYSNGSEKPDCYRLVTDRVYCVKDIVFVYRPNGAEGEKREYHGEQCTVLYDKGDLLEIVCPTISGTVTLGDNDISKSIISYNDAVTKLNSYCRTMLGDNTARSIGSDSNNPDGDNPGMYISSNLENWADGNYSGKGKNGDQNAEQDFVRMLYHGVTSATDSEGNQTSYWIASRMIIETDRRDEFIVKIFGTHNATEGERLWGVAADDSTDTSEYTYGVRACVTVAK